MKAVCACEGYDLYLGSVISPENFHKLDSSQNLFDVAAVQNFGEGRVRGGQQTTEPLLLSPSSGTGLEPNRGTEFIFGGHGEVAPASMLGRTA